MMEQSSARDASQVSPTEAIQAKSSLVADRIEIETVVMSQSSFARSPFALARVGETEVNFNTHSAFGMTDRKAGKLLVVVRLQAIGRLDESAEQDPPEEIRPIEATGAEVKPGEDPRQMFFIQAELCIVYSVSSFDEIDDESVQAFASINGVFNAWPYWREFVQNASVRMGLPALTAPVQRI